MDISCGNFAATFFIYRFTPQGGERLKSGVIRIF